MNGEDGMKKEFKKFTQGKDEVERDYSDRFICEIYDSDGYFMHFHRNLEIYGVIKGTVNVTIDGDSHILTEGQIAVINGLESHSYENEEQAEVFYMHIGTEYLRLLYGILEGNKMERWLLDMEYNQKIFRRITEIANTKEKLSEVRCYGYAYMIFADIVEHYGSRKDENYRLNTDEVMVEIVQYIYDHFSEDLSLKNLSDHFGMSPQAFSRLFNKYVQTDLRAFINDIRVQRVVQLSEKKENRGKPLMDLARECGFVSQMTFYRSYKRNFRFRKMEDR